MWVHLVQTKALVSQPVVELDVVFLLFAKKHTLIQPRVEYAAGIANIVL